MKFIVSWRTHPDKRQAAFTAFSQMTAEDDKRDLGERSICESDDPQAVASWALNWINVLDVQTVMVRDDEEARAVGRKSLKKWPMLNRRRFLTDATCLNSCNYSLP